MKEQNEGEVPQYNEIKKQLNRARRLDYRKEFQTIPHYIPIEKTILDEAEDIIVGEQWRKKVESERQALANLTPEERDRQIIEERFNDLRQSRTVSQRINRALHYRHSELLDNMQQQDPEFINPILTGIRKRPERREKAERAIQRRGIVPRVEDYGEYIPLWERL